MSRLEPNLVKVRLLGATVTPSNIPLPISSGAPPVEIVPPWIVPASKFQGPVISDGRRVGQPFSTVPVRKTLTQVRLKVPRLERTNVPARLTVPLVALIVPRLLQLVTSSVREE